MSAYGMVHWDIGEASIKSVATASRRKGTSVTLVLEVYDPYALGSIMRQIEESRRKEVEAKQKATDAAQAAAAAERAARANVRASRSKPAKAQIAHTTVPLLTYRGDGDDEV